MFVTLDFIGVPQSVRHVVGERAEKEFKLPSGETSEGSATPCVYWNRVVVSGLRNGLSASRLACD